MIPIIMPMMPIIMIILWQLKMPFMIFYLWPYYANHYAYYAHGYDHSYANDHAFYKNYYYHIMKTILHIMLFYDHIVHITMPILLDIIIILCKQKIMPIVLIVFIILCT